jgi:hypothetical protein
MNDTSQERLSRRIYQTNHNFNDSTMKRIESRSLLSFTQLLENEYIFTLMSSNENTNDSNAIFDAFIRNPIA